MASIKLQGDTSGELTISAPAVAGTNTLTLPASTGTLITAADVDLTNLSATNLTSGTIPDARFPATLPAVSGANLTGLPSSPPPTTYGAVGTYVIALHSGNVTSGSTYAGSTLYRNSVVTFGGLNTNAASVIGTQANFPTVTSLGLSGTWRAMTYGGNNGQDWNLGLYVRVS